MIELLTFLLVIVTGIYVLLTARILQSNRTAVQAMREQVAAMVRPYVHFDLTFYNPFVVAVLKNAGRSAAKDVTINLMPSIEREDRHHALTPIMLASQIVTWLPPGKTIEERACTFGEMENRNPDMVYTGSVTYRDQRGECYSESFVIDLSIIKDLQGVSKPETAREIEKLRQLLEKLTTRQRFWPKDRSDNECHEKGR